MFLREEFGKRLEGLTDEALEQQFHLVTLVRKVWPDRHFVPDGVRDYCMFAVPSSAGGGAIVTGAGGR